MNVLCVDPDPEARERTRATLAGAGFDPRTAGSLAAARDVVGDAGTDLDCVVAEYDLGDGTGLELFEFVRQAAPDVACVLYTDRSAADLDTERFGGVVAEYLSKERSGERPGADDDGDGDDGGDPDDRSGAPDGDRRSPLVELVERSVAAQSQTAYPLPDDEDARLAALDRFALDSEALSDALDRLTELATALFDVESAAVGVIDEHHEHFLSCYGLSLDSIDREDSVCTYTILEEGTTVVEDVSEDPRFSDNETLVAANIRFYAGAPIRTDEGAAVGVFCLYDDEPRSFSDRQQELLALLAEEARDQFVLRRRLLDGEETDLDSGETDDVGADAVD